MEGRVVAVSPYFLVVEDAGHVYVVDRHDDEIEELEIDIPELPA